MEARPFVLLGDAALTAIEQCIARAIDTWATTWALPRKDINAFCLLAEERGKTYAAPWCRHSSDHGAEAWFAWSPQFLATVQEHMFHADSSDSAKLAPIAAAVSERAASSLADDILQLLAFVATAAVPEPDDGKPDSRHFKRGSGSVLVNVRIGRSPSDCLTCLFSHDAIRSIVPKSSVARTSLTPLTKREATLAGLRVPLSVEIGNAEVEVGNLLTLSLGDVIRLNTSVDQPMTVSGPGPHALFHGHLGTFEKSIAIEVARRPQ